MSATTYPHTGEPERICYTALFGPYEDLKDPNVVTPNWRYIAYTDQPLTSSVWEVVQVKLQPGEDPQRLARWYKIMHWIDWEYSMWIDAAFKINIDLNDWWARTYVMPFSCAKHPLRTCVYREIASCLANNRGDVNELMAQQEAYRKEGVPDHNDRIITSGILMRHNSATCIKLCEAWWAEVAKHSVRDQVAFAKASIGYRIHTFVWDYAESRQKDFIYFKHFKHRQ